MSAVDHVMTGQSTTTSATVTVTVDQVVPIGRKLVVAATREDGASISAGVTSITDTRGNTYTIHDAISLFANTIEVSLHHADVTTALQIGDVITLTFASASRTRKNLVVHVCSGLTAGAKDATSGTTVNASPTSGGLFGTSSAPSGSTAAATTSAGGLTFAAMGTTSGGGTVTAGSGYTLDASLLVGATTQRRLASEHKETSATGVQTASFSMASSAAWALAIAHYPGTAAPPPNTPPSANAGPDQTNVEPYTSVSLPGSDSDSDGTIASRLWTQTGGTAVTLSGATTATASFTAPGTVSGDTLTFQYQVTDDDGATGADTVSVTVLPAAERILRGGSWVPARVAVI